MRGAVAAEECTCFELLRHFSFDRLDDQLFTLLVFEGRLDLLVLAHALVVGVLVGLDTAHVEREEELIHEHLAHVLHEEPEDRVNPAEDHVLRVEADDLDVEILAVAIDGVLSPRVGVEADVLEGPDD